MYEGVVKTFNTKRGIGIITRDDGAKVTLHFAHMKGATYKTLKDGDRVRFDCEEGRRGPEARNVVKAEEGT